jgi:hypothetical protein
MSLQTIIQIAISLLFAWLVLSLAAMYIQEWIVTRLKWRSKMLEATVYNMLTDPSVAAQLYDHPLIQGLFSGEGGEQKPSYIPAQQFVLALFDIVRNAGTESSLLQQEIYKMRSEINWLKKDEKARAEAQYQFALLAVRKALTTNAGEAAMNQALDQVRAEISNLATISPDLQPAVDQALANVKVNKEQVDTILAQFQTQNAGLSENPALDQIRVGIAALSVTQPQLKQALETLLTGVEEYAIQGESALTTARVSVETWFDDSMDRLSGWYKRRAQSLAFFIGIGVAIVLNGDTLALAQQLWREPVLREALAAQAQAYVNQNPDNPAPPNPDDLVKLQNQFTDLDIPVGWIGNPIELDDSGRVPGLDTTIPSRTCTLFAISNTEEVYGFTVAKQCYPIINAPFLRDGTGWLLKLFGLIASGLAAAQGAPFWFDILKRIVSVRSSGANPAETQKAAG